jgi:pimeloyl-ACP methyl ester carboxylesterase
MAQTATTQTKPATTATQTVTSKDGTRIAYEVQGQGPPVVFVWGALGVRASPFAKRMRDELAKSFTVYDYDRRGRGESGDTKPFAVQREVEDLAALAQAAGGKPYVVASSSGAALALEAAAAGVPMRMLVAHEPPYVQDMDPDYERKVNERVQAGERDKAVVLFMRTVGVPGFMIPVMKLMGFWKTAVATAHTLPYDAAAMNGFKVPTARFARIKTPTVVYWGTKSPASLQKAAQDAAAAIPGAKTKILPKQNHGVKPAALRAALVETLGV